MYYGILIGLIGLLIGIIIGIMLTSYATEGFQSAGVGSDSSDGSDGSDGSGPPTKVHFDKLLKETIPDVCLRLDELGQNHIDRLSDISAIPPHFIEGIDPEVLQERLNNSIQKHKDMIARRKKELGCF